MRLLSLECVALIHRTINGGGDANSTKPNLQFDGGVTGFTKLTSLYVFAFLFLPACERAHQF